MNDDYKKSLLGLGPWVGWGLAMGGIGLAILIISDAVSDIGFWFWLEKWQSLIATTLVAVVIFIAEYWERKRRDEERNTTQSVLDVLRVQNSLLPVIDTLKNKFSPIDFDFQLRPDQRLNRIKLYTSIVTNQNINSKNNEITHNINSVLNNLHTVEKLLGTELKIPPRSSIDYNENEHFYLEKIFFKKINLICYIFSLNLIGDYNKISLDDRKFREEIKFREIASFTKENIFIVNDGSITDSDKNPYLGYDHDFFDAIPISSYVNFFETHPEEYDFKNLEALFYDSRKQ